MNIKIKEIIKSIEDNGSKEYIGKLIDNKIEYISDGVKNIIDIDKKILIRENNIDNYKMEFDFNNNIYKVYVNDLYVNLNIILKKFIIDNNKVEIVYFIEDNEENIIEYFLEYEII